jgi:hypothetical protein
MSSKSDEPLRGEAAWRAAKKLVSEHNEAAWARGRKDRANREVQAANRKIEADRRDRMDLPGHRGQRGQR